MSEENIIEVEIDGLPTPVDKDEWESNEEAVIEQVRHNRTAVNMMSPSFSDEAEGILGNE